MGQENGYEVHGAPCFIALPMSDPWISLEQVLDNAVRVDGICCASYLEREAVGGRYFIA
jgi:hypothetical protein